MCDSTCSAGETLCSDGMCVDTTSDPANCGGCGLRCPTQTPGVGCRMGRCAVTCLGDATHDDCNARVADGCEADLTTDPSNCGACGHACPVDSTCLMGHCQCRPGLTECHGDCVDTSRDVSACGVCDNACAGHPHAATVMCMAGTCHASCDPAYADCNGSASDGCEVNTQSDVRNCGGCARACPDPYRMTCVAGTCRCATGLTQCGSSCVDTTSDRSNCGGCGYRCPGNKVCSGSRCVCSFGTTRECTTTCLTCSAGYVSFCGTYSACCGGAYPNYCDHPSFQCWSGAAIACSTIVNCGGSLGWRACADSRQHVNCANGRCE